ncbi:Ankyrin-3 [Dactylella cylindrospora]|nr:Ankyrin-3 [Dactylella cylindrospora]
MAEYTDPRYGRYSGESQQIQRKPVWGHDNVAQGNPVTKQESFGPGGVAQPGRLEHAVDYTTSNLENLSLDSRFIGQENIDAADFYRFETRRSETSSISQTSTVVENNANRPTCTICSTPACIMTGGSLEAQRLKDIIARMRAARSTAQAAVLGMEYIEPYIEAFDNQWKLDESKVRIDVKNNLSVPNGKLFAETSKGWSPIIPFCSLGKTELVAILLHEGVDVNANAGARNTRPLSHAAAWLGNEDIVELLLAAGADPNSANLHGLTALHFAAAVGNLKAVQILVKAGAHIDAEADDFNGIHSLPVFNQLRESQMKTYHQIIDYLVASGANTNLTSTTKWTALQYICINGSAEIARRLIELGVPREPLEVLRRKAGSEWAFSGYYKDWAARLEEQI